MGHKAAVYGTEDQRFESSRARSRKRLRRRSGIEREFSRSRAAFRTAVRRLPIGTPVHVAIWAAIGQRFLSPALHPRVYDGVVGRTNIEIDDVLIERAMRIYRLRSKREVVDLALRRLVGEPLSLDEARAMEGSGWEGDLDELRGSDRTARL